MGFAEVLTLIFIVLKLIHIVNWSWIWVLSPLWIIYGGLFLLIIIGILNVFIKEYIQKHKKEGSE